MARKLETILEESQRIIEETEQHLERMKSACQAAQLVFDEVEELEMSFAYKDEFTMAYLPFAMC